jgi:acetate kinase
MTVGAYFTLLEGRGALVFGGGIGTHSPAIRARVAAGLRAWDVDLDPGLNTTSALGRISRPDTRAVHVFRTNEEQLIAREVARLLR